MIAITYPERTIYDCNPFQSGPNMIAILEIMLESRDYYFRTNLAKIKFQCLQSYLVPIWKDCNRIWPTFDFSLQSYLVPFSLKLQSFCAPMVILIAIIYGPLYKNYCNYKWSSPILVQDFTLVMLVNQISLPVRIIGNIEIIFI